MKSVGKTPEGISVVANVYSLAETHGIPLDMIFDARWKHRMLPDWMTLLNDMHKAGRPIERCVESICSAVVDAGYPIDFSSKIVETIKANAKSLTK